MVHLYISSVVVLYQISPTAGLLGGVVADVDFAPDPELYAAPLAQNKPLVVIRVATVVVVPKVFA